VQRVNVATELLRELVRAVKPARTEIVHMEEFREHFDGSDRQNVSYVSSGSAPPLSGPDLCASFQLRRNFIVKRSCYFPEFDLSDSLR
jgi:hypothetical protein